MINEAMGMSKEIQVHIYTLIKYLLKVKHFLV